MKIVFIRHGETQLNKANRAQGWSDSFLTETGEMQVKKAGERLKDFKFDAIYSSPLGRAMKTAEVIKQHHDVPFNSSSLLMEYSMGDYEGDDLNSPHWKEIRRKFYLEDYMFPNGESNKIVKDRIDKFLDKLLTEDHTKNHECVLIVCHGGVIHTLLISDKKSLEEKCQIVDSCIENTGTIHLNVELKNGKVVKEFIKIDEIPKKSKKSGRCKKKV